MAKIEMHFHGKEHILGYITHLFEHLVRLLTFLPYLNTLHQRKDSSFLKIDIIFALKY